MSRDFASADPRVQELEELLTLGEASTATLDKISQVVDKFRTQTMLSLIVGYVVGAIAVGCVSMILDRKAASDTALFYLLLGGAGLGFVVTTALIATVFTRFRQNRNALRELRVERDIHSRLISMIDQQMQRVIHSENISPVMRATFEIRVRRMERSEARRA